MKIAFDHQIFALQRFGGISRYICALADQLLQLPGLDDAVRIFAAAHVNDYLRGCEAYGGGVRLPWFRGASRVCRMADALLAPRAMRRFSPDILHETYYAIGPVPQRRARVVLTVHDMIHELFPQSFCDASAMAAVKRRAVARADRIICVSENTRSDLIRLQGVDPGKVSVVHLGCMPARPASGTAPDIARPYLLYVGARRGYKNFRGLLAAYASAPQLRDNFCLVAFGDGRFRPDERQAFELLGLKAAQVVNVQGSDQVLAALYRNAAAFVYPSFYEGFGLPPLEAMSHGCPVVCSRTGSIPEIVGAAACFFDPLSTDSMAAAILQVVDDGSFAAALRAMGFERIKAFSWRRCAEETLTVYRSLS